MAPKKFSVRKRTKKVSKASLRGLSRALAPRGSSLAMGAVRSAPAAVSSILPVRRFDVSSVRGGQMGDKRVSACLPMMTVCAHTTEGFGLVDAAGAYHGILRISPVIPNLLCPLLLNEARNYTRYRFKKLRFIYYAIGSTASGVRLNFAFVNDALQAEFSAITGSSSYNLLSSTPNSVPFSPWSPWSMDCSVSGEVCYTAPYTGTVAANTRQAYTGLIACLADSDPGATFTYGQLWWDFDIELLDVCPTTTGLPTSAALTSATAPEEKTGSASVTVGVAAPNPNIGPTQTLSVDLMQTPQLSRADNDYVRIEGCNNSSSGGVQRSLTGGPSSNYPKGSK